MVVNPKKSAAFGCLVQFLYQLAHAVVVLSGWLCLCWHLPCKLRSLRAYLPGNRPAAVLVPLALVGISVSWCLHRFICTTAGHGGSEPELPAV